MHELTEQEKAANYDTFRHIERVRNLLNKCAIALLKRGERHDQSKLLPPEVSAMAANTPDLPGLTYGTKEYAENLKKPDLDKALSHHYANNDHHPQHFRNGIEDMNLLQLLEAFVDWKASSERHVDGNLRKSIEVNANRFSISPQLVKILENTIDVLVD